jgi:aminoglycoside/choline kinase family phosphotransferase
MHSMQEDPSKNTPPNEDMMAGTRFKNAQNWAASQLGQDSVNLIPVSGDASFRRYYRIETKSGPLILMDALPEKENSEPFLDVSLRLRQAGVNAPDIFQFDLQSGFGLIEDLGDELYKSRLTTDSADSVFPDLFKLLVQFAKDVDSLGLPDYGHALLQKELDLFPDWYLGKHKNISWNPGQIKVWQDLCALLRSSALEQPQVFVHRDFHSCNLLFREDSDPGVIDFQDAVRGPLSYDLVSLLWDRYISWPRNNLESWIEDCRILLEIDCSPSQWLRWCDLMGLQRNLKIVGIFARLHYRDGKTGYLEMIPVFYQYLLDVLPRYPEFQPFLELMEQTECAP